MFLANNTPWETITSIATLITTALVLLIAISLYLTVRNLNNGRMRIRYDYLSNPRHDKVRIAFFNVGKFDANLFSVGFIVDKHTIECIDMMLEGNMKYVPCLSKSQCDFSLTSEQCIKKITDCTGKVTNKMKISAYCIDTYGNKTEIKIRNLVKMYNKSKEIKKSLPPVVEEVVIEDEEETALD